MKTLIASVLSFALIGGTVPVWSAAGGDHPQELTEAKAALEKAPVAFKDRPDEGIPLPRQTKDRPDQGVPAPRGANERPDQGVPAPRGQEK